MLSCPALYKVQSDTNASSSFVEKSIIEESLIKVNELSLRSRYALRFSGRFHNVLFFDALLVDEWFTRRDIGCLLLVEPFLAAAAVYSEFDRLPIQITLFSPHRTNSQRHLYHGCGCSEIAAAVWSMKAIQCRLDINPEGFEASLLEFGVNSTQLLTLAFVYCVLYLLRCTPSFGTKTPPGAEENSSFKGLRSTLSRVEGIDYEYGMLESSGGFAGV
ncbi:hypothetical protein VNI00_016050 [Paramarasmius palmivorus]|uniref:Uncharacterized protein n=1 Tax=Paramarasmius palmivorus TaxID=297713 RepID=A0AAW0BHC1_9AGAR